MSVNKTTWRLAAVFLLLLFFFRPSVAQEGRNDDNIFSVEIDTSDYISLRYSGALGYNLMIAASKGMTTEIDRLITMGADVNSYNEYGLTPIFFAVYHNKPEAVRALMKYSPKIDIFNAYQESLLLIAVKNNYLDIAETLIRAGAQIDLSDSEGAAPLHYAALYGFAAMTDMLLYYDAQVNLKAKDGFSALHAAIYAGNVEITDILIHNGANMESRDNAGNTPFLLAASFGDTLIMNMLYKYGVDIYASNNQNHNALVMTIAFNHKDAVIYLLQIGDKWNNGLNPYKVAAKYGRKDIVTVLQNSNMPEVTKFSFDQVEAVFSTYARFTKNNFYSGFSISLREPYLNAGITAGLNTKLWETKLLVEQSQNTFYQYVDKSSMFYAGLFKDFVIANNRNTEPVVFSTSLSAGYTFGNKFKGTEIYPERKMVFIPGIAIKWSVRPVTFFMGVDYLNLNYYKAGSVWATLGLSYNFYFDNMRIKQQRIKWY